MRKQQGSPLEQNSGLQRNRLCSWSSGYITIHSVKDFVDRSKVKVLGMGSLGWPHPIRLVQSLGWPRPIRLVLCEILQAVTERGQHKDRRGTKCLALKTEEGAPSQGMQKPLGKAE